MDILTYKSNNEKLSLELKITNDLNNVKSIQHTINKYYVEYLQKNIYYKFLADEYQPVTFSLYQIMFKKTIGNYLEISNKKDDNIKIINDTIQVGNYTLLPVPMGYNFNIISPLTFNFINIIEELPENSSVCVLNCIGPWNIKNNKLHLYFELETLLKKSRNCIVKTIFVLIDYGENIKYDDIVVDSEDMDYIILDENNLINGKQNINNSVKDFIKEDIDNVFFIDIKLYSNLHCQYEVASLPFYILFINILLKYLKPSGNLYLELNNFKLYKPSIQLFYFLSNIFYELQILINTININKYGIYKFNNFLKNDDVLNNLELLISNYIKKDKYLGQNTLVKAYNIEYCDNLEKNIRKPNIDFVIKSIMLNKIKPSFEQFIINSYKIKRKQFKKQLYRINYLENLGKKIDLNMILANNIQKSIDFCNEHNIKINSVYNNFTVLNYDNVVKFYFNIDKKINPKDIKLSIDSIYSITRPQNSVKMFYILKKHFPSINYLIDGNANIGSTSVVFAKFYKHIYAVEYSEDTFLKLNNNIKVFKLNDKVTTYNDDIIKFMNDNNKLKKINFNRLSFCLFLDPPWTGVFYKTEKSLDLYLSDINILDFIKETNIQYVCIKVPFNYNFSKLYTYFYDVIIYRLSGFYFILIKK